MYWRQGDVGHEAVPVSQRSTPAACGWAGGVELVEHVWIVHVRVDDPVALERAERR